MITVSPQTLDELQWHVMPRDQGQIVEVSYAADERGLWRRKHDRSDSTTSLEFADYDDSDDEFEPWNGKLPAHGKWQPVTI